jgi:hypothetical protein
VRWRAWPLSPPRAVGTAVTLTFGAGVLAMLRGDWDAASWASTGMVAWLVGYGLGIVEGERRLRARIGPLADEALRIARQAQSRGR